MLALEPPPTAPVSPSRPAIPCELRREKIAARKASIIASAPAAVGPATMLLACNVALARLPVGKGMLAKASELMSCALLQTHNAYRGVAIALRVGDVSVAAAVARRDLPDAARRAVGAESATAMDAVVARLGDLLAGTRGHVRADAHPLARQIVDRAVDLGFAPVILESASAAT